MLFSLLCLILHFFVLIDSTRELDPRKSTQLQFFLPIEEFRVGAENELKAFENLFVRRRISIKIGLCAELASDDGLNVVERCLHGFLLKISNENVQLREFQSTSTLDETVGLVFNSISNFLGQTKRIDENEDLEDLFDHFQQNRSLVIVHDRSLHPKLRLEISRLVLSFGQWFFFAYRTDENNCRYSIYSSRTESHCARDYDIQILLERRLEEIFSKSNSISSFDELIRFNAFPRLSPALYYVGEGNRAQFNSIPIDLSKFSPENIQQHVVLHGPYPFYLFWSVKKNRFERLGDQPSEALFNRLFYQEQTDDERSNLHGMFDDELRNYVDRLDPIEIEADVIFLKAIDEYRSINLNEKPAVILFSLKWDSTSILARRAFHQVAKSLKTILKFIDVDCYDWAELCDEENLVEWPQMFVIKQDQTKISYRGTSNVGQLSRFLFRTVNDQPYKSSDVLSFTSIDDILKCQRWIIIARLPDKQRTLLEVYRKLVENFRHDERFFFIYEFSEEKSNLIVKDNFGDFQNSFEPKTTIFPFDNDFNYLKGILDDLLRIRIIPFNLLNESIFQSKLFLVASRSQLSRMTNLLTKFDSSDQETIFWVDLNSATVLSLNRFGDIAYPAWIYLNRTQGSVYVNSNIFDVEDWLEKIRVNSILPFWENLSMNDSIFIDGQPSQKAFEFNESDDEEIRSFHEMSQRVNEHGLGFDTNGIPIDI